jgi:2-hydroxy-3-oxopropionate reductase
MGTEHTIGFGGLGVMGRPMAHHLLTAGYRVVVYNRSRPAVDTLVDAGAVGVEKLSELGEQADFVITMLPDSPDIEEVLFTTGGLCRPCGRAPS